MIVTAGILSIIAIGAILAVSEIKSESPDPDSVEQSISAEGSIFSEAETGDSIAESKSLEIHENSEDLEEKNKVKDVSERDATAETKVPAPDSRDSRISVVENDPYAQFVVDFWMKTKEERVPYLFGQSQLISNGDVSIKGQEDQNIFSQDGGRFKGMSVLRSIVPSDIEAKSNGWRIVPVRFNTEYSTLDQSYWVKKSGENFILFHPQIPANNEQDFSENFREFFSLERYSSLLPLLAIERAENYYDSVEHKVLPSLEEIENFPENLLGYTSCLVGRFTELNSDYVGYFPAITFRLSGRDLTIAPSEKKPILGLTCRLISHASQGDIEYSYPWHGRIFLSKDALRSPRTMLDLKEGETLIFVGSFVGLPNRRSDELAFASVYVEKFDFLTLQWLPVLKGTD